MKRFTFVHRYKVVDFILNIIYSFVEISYVNLKQIQTIERNNFFKKITFLIMFFW